VGGVVVGDLNVVGDGDLIENPWASSLSMAWGFSEI